MSEEAQAQEAPATEVASSASSLSDLVGGAPAATPTDASTGETPTESATATTGSEWSWTDGINGDGDKPDWLKDRYKSVADQAKAYPELEKKMGEFRGAPKDGYNLEGLESINKDDPLIGHFAETFKDLNLSQAGFERIATEFAELQNSQGTAALEAEMKKLGPDGKSRVQETIRILDNKFEPEVAGTIKNWLCTAQDVEALGALIASIPKSSVPTYDQAYQQPDYESVKEVLTEKESNWSRYKEDENYRNSIKRRHYEADRRDKAMRKSK